MTPSLTQLPRLGGLLCLDFVNTVDPRYGDDRIEYLGDYASLAEWAAWIGAVPPERRDALLADGGEDPGRAAAVHRRALALREDLHALLRPESRAAPDDGSLRRFNRELQAASRHFVLEKAAGGYAGHWETGKGLDEVLWPVARSAAELMLSPDALRRVRECQGVDCGWLFIDTSKAGRRRWCSMDVCGNRMKSSRYRQRVREAGRLGSAPRRARASAG